MLFAISVNGQPFCTKSVDAGASTELSAYLNVQLNQSVDIEKLDRILAMQHVILEMGSGTCEVAYEIALCNPGSGVIATDAYAWDVSVPESSGYQKVARQWKQGQLRVQQNVPDNLVILRADTEILSYIPDQRIDSLLLVNPEASVGHEILSSLSDRLIYDKLKPGCRQLVIVPFSREMGIIACGGNEFEHAADWSKGLGFMKASEFDFEEADKVQWGVDLRGLSLYSKNSTQQNVYLSGSEV